MESHRAREVRLELERLGYVLLVRYGRVGGPDFQVIDTDGNLVAGDHIDGCHLETVELFAFPDLARWTPDLAV